MFDIYILAPYYDTESWYFRGVINGALIAGDWYVSDIPAMATMDQLNGEILENISREAYESGEFTLYGCFRFSFEGLV